jgi:hypothetical protein
MEVHPTCLFKHWSELRLLTGDANYTNTGLANYERAQMVKAHYSYARRHGLDALKGRIVAALRSEKVLDFSYLLIGAAFWPELPLLFTRVYQGLQAQDREQRVASTFASACFLDNDDVACLLAERVVVEQGERLTLQAAREVLEIAASIQHGGACPRCHRRREDRIPRVVDLDIGLPVSFRPQNQEKNT